jgi:guanine deaminase
MSSPTPAATTEPYRWIFRGNIIVPTGHPFCKSTVEDEAMTPEVLVLPYDQTWVGEQCTFLKLLRDHILAVDKDGIIQALQPARDYLKEEHQQHQQQRTDDSDDDPTNNEMFATCIQQLADHEFLLPGLIDLHIHAAQFGYTGTATDRTLFEWLDQYTFPAEARLAHDAAWARQLYRDVVATTLSYGTTMAVYHTTLHLQPCKTLVDIAMNLGQRAIIGKVSMDRNSPDFYQHGTEQNVAESIALIEYIHGVAGRRHRVPHAFGGRTEEDNRRQLLPLILPMVTPRFIPTCSPELLSRLGEVAQTYDCFISTHISEGVEEVAYTRACDEADHQIVPGRTGTQILQAHGLLSDQCVLAHGVHLDDPDAALLRQYKSAVCHCPLSNYFFAKGVFPCRKWLTLGNRIGLGTDVAGGYSPSLWATQRDTVISSRCLANHQYKSRAASGDDYAADSSSLDYRHALWLATLGGAQALGLEDWIGTLAVGMEFDAIIISPADSPIRCYPTDSVVDVFQKLCVLGDDRNVKRVFVQGREVTTPK